MDTAIPREFAQQHGRLRDRLAAARRELEAIEASWLRLWSEAAPEVLDEYAWPDDLSEREAAALEERADDLRTSLVEFLRSPGARAPEFSGVTASEVEEAVGPYRDRLSEAAEHYEDARAPFFRLGEELGQRLQKWADDLDEERLRSAFWRTLREWRTAADLTKTEAAEHLGVSAAAVVRYEKQDRRPSYAQARLMLQRMAASGGLPVDSKQRRAAEYIVSSLGDGTSATDLLSATHDRTAEEAAQAEALREDLSTAVERLSGEQLEVLLRLASNPDALDLLRRIAAEDPFRVFKSRS